MELSSGEKRGGNKGEHPEIPFPRAPQFQFPTSLLYSQGITPSRINKYSRSMYGVTVRGEQVMED